MSNYSATNQITKVIKGNGNLPESKLGIKTYNYLTTGKFAQAIGVSKATVIKWVNMCLLEPVMVADNISDEDFENGVVPEKFHYEFSELLVKKYFANSLFPYPTVPEEETTSKASIIHDIEAVNTNPEDYYNLGEFASEVGVSKVTVLNWIKNDYIFPHHVNPSGDRYFSKSQLEELREKVSSYYNIEADTSEE